MVHIRRTLAPIVMSYGPSAIATSTAMNRIVSTVIVRVPGFSVDEASHLRAPAPPLAGCRVLVGIGGEERLDGGGVAQLPRVQRIARIRRVSPREFTEGPLQNPPSIPPARR